MKFELDHRTGMMRQKKDEEIYFAQSQSGGLIVDDKKNNIKYIIERDERITKLFGSFDKDELNLYDMRDARIIADRVVRLLGRDHKYSDFHYFLRGYHMDESVVEKCSDFLGESIWSDIQKRSGGENSRAEDKNVIGILDDGTKLRIPMEDLSKGEIIKFDDDKKYYTLYDGFYLAVINENGNDIYYIYDPDSEDDENMVEIAYFNSDTFRTKYEFVYLRAVIQSACDLDEGIIPSDLEHMNISISNGQADVEFSNGRYEYLVFDDHNDAVKAAIDYERDTIDEIEIDKYTVQRWRNILGDEIFDEDELKEVFKESYESYYDDLDEQEAIDELMRLEIIEDTEEYFELDEDGDVDYEQPKFYYQNYKDEYVEKMLEGMNVIDEYITQFGYDDIKKYIDLDKVCQKAVDADGPGQSLASYDSEEREVEIDGATYYIYRRN